ncbi:hypothetical protein Hanom_Chr06g00577941 [Helianthus anomalus]
MAVCGDGCLSSLSQPSVAKLEISDLRGRGEGGSKTYIPKNFYRTGGFKTYIPKSFYTKATYLTLLSEKFVGARPLLTFAPVNRISFISSM